MSFGHKKGKHPQNFTRFRRRKKRSKFNPDREYCDKARDEFLENGGKITKIELVDGEYTSVDVEYTDHADEFLLE